MSWSVACTTLASAVLQTTRMCRPGTTTAVVLAEEAVRNYVSSFITVAVARLYTAALQLPCMHYHA